MFLSIRDSLRVPKVLRAFVVTLVMPALVHVLQYRQNIKGY